MYATESCKAAFEVESVAADSQDFKTIQDCLMQALEKINAKRSAIEAFPMSFAERVKPSNSNAEKQQRYFPRKKKQKSKHTTSERSQVMKSLLPLRLHPAPCEPTKLSTAPNNPIIDYIFFSSDDVPIGEEIDVEN
ncbi:unnamed protein product [Allacma fusca]|uniref:Uncharacterized protein n=1 Tax=Allacma fusca TaxID=39272 RepID=A0A8J2JHA0_9HEXA|nr:unnamed protein product [Allacma fusca]